VIPQLCAENLIDADAVTMNVVITVLSFDLPSWMMWGFDLPDFSIDVECCIYTKIATLSVIGTSMDNSVKGSNIALNAEGE
jgi:hypothetical protein